MKARGLVSKFCVELGTEDFNVRVGVHQGNTTIYLFPVVVVEVTKEI
jgi:hypothetical protein